MNYDTAFSMVIGHEGGFTEHRNDRGNWTSGIMGQGQLKGTKYGISAMAYPSLDIKNLTLQQAKDIYKRDYWDKVSGDQLPPLVAFNVFDGAINSGIGRSARWLQMAVGATPDGAIGPATLRAVAAQDERRTVTLYCAERLLFLASMNPTVWNNFGRGLVNRVAHNLKL